jgi:hypothetical protein
MSTNSNVIPFPSKNKNVHNNMPDPEVVKQSIIKVKKEDADVIADMLSSGLAEALEQSGFTISENEDTLRSFLMTAESLRAFIHRCYGIEHGFHPIADQCFVRDAESVDLPQYLFVTPMVKITKSEVEPDPEVKLSDDGQFVFIEPEPQVTEVPESTK